MMMHIISPKPNVRQLKYITAYTTHKQHSTFIPNCVALFCDVMLLMLIKHIHFLHLTFYDQYRQPQWYIQ